MRVHVRGAELEKARETNQARGAKAPVLRAGMDRIWREILDDARWAPSPHNTQPWFVKVLSPEAAEVYAPRERLLPVEDPGGRFETAAQGIFLEALDVAAGKLGLAVEAEPLLPSLGADADDRSLVARLRLVPLARARPLLRAVAPPPPHIPPSVRRTAGGRTDARRAVRCSRRTGAPGELHK